MMGAGKLAEDATHEGFRVAEKHKRLIEIKEGIVDSGEAGGHAAPLDLASSRIEWLYRSNPA